MTDTGSTIVTILDITTKDNHIVVNVPSEWIIVYMILLLLSVVVGISLFIRTFARN